MSCARPSAEEQSRIAKEASKGIAPALKGLTRFMINHPEIEKSLGAGRAALLFLLFESPSQTAHPLNRFVDESRKKRKSAKKGSKTWINKNQIGLVLQSAWIFSTSSIVKANNIPAQLIRPLPRLITIITPFNPIQLLLIRRSCVQNPKNRIQILGFTSGSACILACEFPARTRRPKQ